MARDSASLIRDIQSTLRGWKEFDLTKKKGELEEAGIEISDAREKSSTSRKHLSSMTRDFKKLPEDEKIKGFGPVIKAYQAEIDNITKRAKHAEGAFLPLYASLYEASDPAPVLERAVEELSKTSTLVTQLAEVEDLNKKLVKEIEDYKKDFTTIRSQAPIIRKLEEKIKAMEVEMDAKIAKEVAASKSEAKKEESARKDEYLEREEGLKRELMKERELCKEMGQRVDRLQSELMEAKSQLETSGGDASTQIELLSEEVTRLQAREITLEKERDDLQRQYLDLWKKTKNEEGQGKEKGEAQQRERNALVESLRETVQNLEHDNKRLRIAMERAEEDAREQRADHADAVQRAMHNTHALSVEVEKVKSELAKRPAKDEYDRVCDELRSLKALHFNEYDGASRGGDVAAITEQSLESLLAEKNRTLEAAVAKAKEASSRLEREKDELKEKIDALQREVEKKAELIEQLEKDVELVAAKRHTSGLEELLEGMEGVEEEEEGEGQKREGENGEVSMLKIICHQRDRFKQRVDEMDEELRGERQKQSKLTKRMEELQSDNLRLYEKVKFLEGYRPKGQADSTRDVEDRYGQLYSQSMNPFQAFNKAQEKEREKQLNPIERMLLMMSQFFLSNKQARIFLFVYMVILHLIVSLTLQHFASVKHDHC